MLRYRLRWYALSTARLLLRRWQALVLVIGVLVSANASVFSNLDTLAHPILLLLAPGHGPVWRFGYVLLLLAAAALWAHMQGVQIGGGAFMAFAGSLPFSARQRRRVDLAVLVLADSPLLLMLAGALSSAAAHGGGAAQLLLLAALLPLALLAQLAVLERRADAGLAVVLLCLVPAACFGTALAAPASVLAGAAAWLALQRAPWPRSAIAAASLRLPAPAWPGRLLSAVAGRHAPALRLSFGILLRERRDETLAKALASTVLIVAAAGLGAAFGHDVRAIVAAWIAQGLVALQLSGLFRGLQMAHLASAGYANALPLPQNWWRPFDRLALLGVGLPFLGAAALLAWIEGATPAHALAGLASYAALLCALRGPQLVSERHAVVLSTLLAGCWMAATIACLYQIGSLSCCVSKDW